ncbi:MAG: retropepsin-like aspartic protease [Bacteroidia bacterium]|nr:retropepsin-like aspartic protease [Bacteroidia bacterium]
MRNLNNIAVKRFFRSGKMIRPMLFLTILLFLTSFRTHKAGVPDPALISVFQVLSTGNPSNSREEPMGDFQSITIPLRRVGKLLLIEARIGDQTGNFVFDTGASRLVLNCTYFKKDLWVVEENARGITGSVEKLYRTRVPRIDVSGLYFENVFADVINLGQIETRRGVKILGLFGLDLFRNLEMVIDVNRGELKLYRIDRAGKRISADADTLKTTLISPIREAGGVVFMPATLGGKSVDFCLDTGAEANVLSSSSSRKVLNTVTITRRCRLTGSGSEQMEVMYGTMNDFILGGQQLQPMETIITSLQSIVPAYSYPFSGVLGFDFFEKGVVCINLVKEELYMCLIGEQMSDFAGKSDLNSTLPGKIPNRMANSKQLSDSWH